MSALKAINLNVWIGRSQILRDISLDAMMGRWISIIGANGAGKSTLLHALAGWHFSKLEGQLILENTALRHTARREIALVSGPNDLPNYLLGKELIDIISRERQLPLHKNWREILGVLDGEIWYDRPISVLSWGTKKKICLACAVCTNPKFLLLDESFDGLDAISSLKIRKLFAKMVQDKEVGIISAAHSWESVFAYSDEVYFMKEGAIIKQVSKNEFLPISEEAKRIEQMVANIFNGAPFPK